MDIYVISEANTEGWCPVIAFKNFVNAFEYIEKRAIKLKKRLTPDVAGYKHYMIGSRQYFIEQIQLREATNDGNGHNKHNTD